MSYKEFSNKLVSEKATLATIDAVKLVKIFSIAGSNWTRAVDGFVVGVKEGGVSISSWTFDPKNKLLTIIGGSNPSSRDISITLRFFFSTSPLIAPYDLSSGEEVEWQPFITSIGSIGQTLDEEEMGVVLESSSSITMINRGYFDDIFDTYIWENQQVKIYSYFMQSPLSDARQIFDGVVSNKSFSDSQVVFSVNDFVFKLQDNVNLGLFSDSDGIILPSMIGKPKRRIYGLADYVKCTSLDATLNGYQISGTVSGAGLSKTITGLSTFFLSELSPGDKITFLVNGISYSDTVDAINSNTSLDLSKEIATVFPYTTAVIKPDIAYRRKNRKWSIAGHKLRKKEAAITAIKSDKCFTVDNVEDFMVDDAVFVNGIEAVVLRIVDNDIVTKTNIAPSPSVGNFIVKNPIKNAFIKQKEVFINRDFSIINTDSEASIVFDELAEFNIADERVFGFSLSFTNGSNTVSTSATVDLNSIIKPRDWIRSELITETSWYEVLSVKPQQLILRTSFSGATGTKNSRYKNVEYIDENSLITVNCAGMESRGGWIKTAADCARNLLLVDAGFPSVNEASFSQAKIDSSAIISMLIPEQEGGSIPKIRDVLTKINETVKGAIFGSSASSISFSILNTTKPQTSEMITDSDILSFSVSSKQKIANSVIYNYRPYIDIFSGESATKTIQKTSPFVDKYIGIKNEISKNTNMYEDKDAEIASGRELFYKSLSSTVVQIKGKLNLANYSVGDKIYLSFDRLYKRFAGLQKEKLGMITSVKIDGINTELTVSDLGNLFNRVMSIAPGLTSDYSSSSNEDKIKYSYMVSSATECPGVADDNQIGSNIIG